MTLNQQDKFFLLCSFGVAAVGVGLMVGGFILRFGRGFGTFVSYAKADDDFLQLGRLDIVFGLFTAAAGVLLISFFIALVATYKRNKFLLYTYCGIIALMIVIQLVAGLLGFQYSDSIKVLSNDDTGVLHQSLNKTIALMQANNGVIGDDNQSNFWKHTQQVFTCCGVQNYKDWGPYAMNQTILSSTNCYAKQNNNGCEKQIHDRIAQDSQYLAVASMGVLLVEIIASFLAGYRAYNLSYEEQNSL